MRKNILRAPGSSSFLRVSSFWIATAQATASTTLGKSARRLSPTASTTRPRCWRISPAMASR